MFKKDKYEREHKVPDPFKKMYDSIMNPEERRKSRKENEKKQRLERKKKDVGLNFD